VTKVVFIKAGLVHVTVEVPGQPGEPPKKRLVAKLGDGSYVGEMSCLEHTNATATVTVVEESQLYTMNAEDFNHLAETHPSWGKMTQRVAALRKTHLQTKQEES